MDPLQGQPGQPGYFWVIPQNTGVPIIARVDWNYPSGTASLQPELHCSGYVPANGDVWYGPIDPPVAQSASIAPVTQES